MTDYLALARQTQGAALRHLGHFGGASDCASAPYLSYRVSDAEPQWSDHWYNAMQLWADVALLRADPAFGRCTIDKLAAFMDCYWHPSGGYLGRGRPDGSLVLEPDRYSDDNEHTGLAFLDAWEATGDRRYLELAERVADYLVRSELHDDTFGGGFWWVTRRGDTPEGKPAISQGQAIQLFARLHGATGRRAWRAWALRVDRWTDESLFDPAAGLYRWSVSFADCAARAGREVARRFFNYDQGIMIEAKLALRRHVEADPAYLERARLVAKHLESALWHPGEGGLNLERGVEQVYAIYSSWLTPSLLVLYAEDSDPRWLDLARRNVDALNGYLRAPDGGYYPRAFVQGGGWLVDRTRDTAASAGMQRAMVLLAQALGSSGG